MRRALALLALALCPSLAAAQWGFPWTFPPSGSSGTQVVSTGGTGVTSCTAYSPVVAGTTSTGPFRCTDGPGTLGYLWTSNGAGVTPSWQAAPAGFSAAGSGSELQARSTGSTVQAVTGSSTVNGGIALVNQSAAAIPFSITGAASQSGNLFNITSNGGTAGNLFAIAAGSSPVNGFLLTPGAAGSPGVVTIGASGTDTNVGIALTAKGSGGIRITTSGTAANPGLQIGDVNGGLRRDTGVSDGVQVVSYGTLPITFSYIALGLSPGLPLAWGSSGSGNEYDTNLSRIAAGVVGVGTGAAGNHAGFIQYGGSCTVATDQTNATTTPQTAACYNVTSGTVAIALAAGRTYAGTCTLFVSDSVAADGATIDFDAGTATATTFRAATKLFSATVAEDAYSQTTALATDVASGATLTGASSFEVSFSLKVNAAGTWQPRFFQSAHSTGTLTLAAGSNCLLTNVTP